MQGFSPIRVELSHTFPTTLLEAEADARFGDVPSASAAPLSAAPVDQGTSQTYYEAISSIGVLDSRDTSDSLGGYQLQEHHHYDPVTRTLWMGDGRVFRPRKGAYIFEHIAGGNSGLPDLGDGGDATASVLDRPNGLAVAGDGSLYVADLGNGRIRRILPDGTITTVAGGGAIDTLEDGHLATEVRLRGPADVALARDGSLLIAEEGRHAIRRVRLDGRITTLAGNGTGGFAGDGGDARAAQLDRPSSVAVAPDGSVVVADTENHRVRRVSTDGLIRTIAGTGEPGSDGDGGYATSAGLWAPAGVAVDPFGNVFVVEPVNHTVRRIGVDGIIDVYAGTPGVGGYDGDGGLASDATLSAPRDVAIGPSGSLFVYIADFEVRHIREIGTDGIIRTLALTEATAEPGDPAPSDVELASWGVAVAPDGDVYVSDQRRAVVFAVRPPLPGRPPEGEIAISEAALPSGASGTTHFFDVQGRHLRTTQNTDPALEAGLVSFTYEAGLLKEMSSEEGMIALSRDDPAAPLLITAADVFRVETDVDRLASRLSRSGVLVSETLYRRGLIDLVVTAEERSFEYDDRTCALPVAILSFEGVPAVVGEGAIASLVWETRNAVSCEISYTEPGQPRTWFSVPANGAMDAVPQTSLTYRLGCFGPYGDATAAASITFDPNLPSAPSATLSTVQSVPEETIADVAYSARILVQVLGENGVPLPGQRVRLDATGSDVNVEQPPPTDILGESVGYVRTGVIQDVFISAVVNAGVGEVPLADVVRVRFVDPNLSFDTSDISFDALPVERSTALFLGDGDGPIEAPGPLDFQAFEESEQLLSSYDMLLGQSAEAPAGGLILQSPFVFLQETSLDENGLVFGKWDEWSVQLGSYFAPGGTPYIRDVHGGLAPPGSGPCACGALEPLIGCGPAPEPGPCSSCPGPGPCDSCPALGDVGPVKCNESCLKPVYCLEPNPTLPQLEGFDDLACAASPPDVPLLCQQVSGVSAGCAGFCRGDTDFCVALGVDYGEGGALPTPECVLGTTCADPSDDCGCSDTTAEELAEWLDLIDPDRIDLQVTAALCQRDPGHIACAQSTLDKLCEGRGSPFCEALRSSGLDQDLESKVTDVSCSQDTSPLARQACLRCFEANGRACFLSGPDPRLFDEEEDTEDDATDDPSEQRSDVKTNQINDAVEGKTAAEGGSQDSEGEPVAVGSGELFFDATDAAFASRGALFELKRSYRSGGSRSGSLGPGWMHTFEDYLEPIGDAFNRNGAPDYCVESLPIVTCLLRYDNSGGRHLYVLDRSTGVFTPEPGRFDVIHFSGDTFVSYEPGGGERVFDVVGNLEEIRDAQGFGLTIYRRIRTPHEVPTDGNAGRYGVTSLFDAILERFGYAFDGQAQAEDGVAYPHGPVSRLNLFTRMELSHVVDSYGRRFDFVHRSFTTSTPGGLPVEDCAVTQPDPDTSTGGARRRRLHQLCYRGEPIVQYGYTWLDETREAYLTKVTRHGLSSTPDDPDAALTEAPPRVTEYEYQHALLQPGGALFVDDDGVASTAWGQAIFDLATRVTDNMNACGWSAAQLAQGGSALDRENCSALEPGLDNYGANIIVFGVPNTFGEIQRAIADNLVRVYAGGSGDGVPVEVETFFEPDPRSADFDRVLRQRFGAAQGIEGLRTVETREGAQVFEWRSSFAELRLRQASVGAPSELAPSLPSYSTALDGVSVLELANIDVSITRPIAIPHPLRRSEWFSDNVTVPAQVTDAVPFVDSEPPEPDPEAPTCAYLDGLNEMPVFGLQSPAGRRIDENLEATPIVARTRESCAAIAGRLARDPFRNEAAKYCGDEPGLPACADVRNAGKRRRALEWDLARVCRWVQVEHRDSRVEYLGLNFAGQTLVEAIPPAGVDPAFVPGEPAGGFVITVRRYTADGMLAEERRQVRSPEIARGGSTIVEYMGDASFAGSVLFRGSPRRLTEIAASSPHLDDAQSVARDWVFSYEPAFQQLRALRQPDASIVESFYSYEEVSDGTLVTALAKRFRRMGFSLDDTGKALLPEQAQQTGAWRRLGQDLDGDGFDGGGKPAAGLVLSIQRDVDLGNGVLGDVGARMLRDASGRLRVVSRVKRYDDPSQDFEPIEYHYYARLDDAERGGPASSHGAPQGPLHSVRVLREKGASSADDIDEESYVYDAIGGVRLIRRNGDGATDTVVQRSALGDVVRVENAAGLVQSIKHDRRGDVIEVISEDLSGHGSPPQVTAIARTGTGQVSGTCTEIDDGACADFQSFADDVAARLRAGSALPELSGASWRVTAYDADERPLISADAAGGHVERSYNAAGLLASVNELGAPSSRTTYSYDAMGRLLTLRVLDLEDEPEVVERFRHDCYSRLSASQRRGPLVATSLSRSQGTITELRYDVMDRLRETWQHGDDGSGIARRVLSQERYVYNEAGAEIARASLAVSAPPEHPVAAGTQLPHEWLETVTRYDEALRPKAVETDGISVPTTFVYDGFGLRLSASPHAIVERLIHPASRLVEERIVNLADGANASESYAVRRTELDPAYRPVRIARAEVAPWTTGEPVVELTPRLTRAQEFDGLSQLVSSTAESGRASDYAYDGAGRLIVKEEIDRDGTLLRTTTYKHDALGRLTSEQGPELQGARRRYDQMGRLIEEELGDRLPVGRSILTTHVYDAAGRPLGRRTSRDDGSRRHTAYQYAPNAAAPEIVQVDDELALTFLRDGLERPVLTWDENLATPYDDPAGLIESTAQMEVSVSYDSLGRTTEERTSAMFGGAHPASGDVVPMGTLAFDYGADVLGPRVVTTPGQEKLSFAYSSSGNVQALRRTSLPISREVVTELSYTGGLFAFAETLAAGGSFEVAKPRNGFLQIESSVTFGPDKTSGPQTRHDVLYGPDGRVTAQRSEGGLSGVWAKGYSYDGLKRLSEQRIAEGAAAPSLSSFLSQKNAALANESAGALFVPADVTSASGFSDIDNLEEAAPDEHGRRYRASHASFAGAPPETVDGSTIARDSDHRVSSDEHLTYVHDALDRLSLVLSEDGEELWLAYDALGRRRIERRLVEGGTEEVALHYLGANVIEEVSVASGAVARTATHGPAVDMPLYASDGPTDSASDRVYVLGTDVRGDVVVAFSAASGEVVEESLLSPWGERTLYRPDEEPCVDGLEGADGSSRPLSACASRSSVLGRFGIGGARAHERTKLVDLRGRVYATHLRSFLARDPMGSVDSLGLWSYVAGDPINWRDPWGLEKSEKGVGEMIADGLKAIGDAVSSFFGGGSWDTGTGNRAKVGTNASGQQQVVWDEDDGGDSGGGIGDVVSGVVSWLGGLFGGGGADEPLFIGHQDQLDMGPRHDPVLMGQPGGPPHTRPEPLERKVRHVNPGRRNVQRECGAACVIMAMETETGERPSFNEIDRLIKRIDREYRRNPNAGAATGALAYALQKKGLKGRREFDATVDDVITATQRGVPVIARVDLPSTGPHFIIVDESGTYGTPTMPLGRGFIIRDPDPNGKTPNGPGFMSVEDFGRAFKGEYVVLE